MSNCLKKIKSIFIIPLDSNLTYNQNSNELFFNEEKVSLGKKENLLRASLKTNQ